jgi:pyruvate/2-oxoglutarate dehydrogenase complex dihydrolipoamide dehydrogenase (E3) component
LDHDRDPAETREWLEALDSVAFEGIGRVDELLNGIVQAARRKGAKLPFAANTTYVNTIAPHDEPAHPGDRAIEHKIRSLIRWNAAAIVLRANKTSSELGGHIASFQSAATLYDTGFMHFWRAPTDTHGGDLVYYQGHCSPGIYARAFLEGRLSEELLNFRQEVDGKGMSSYPHPWLMPDFWQFPTVSMGLGPLMAIYQARFLKYLDSRGLADTKSRKVWAFMGDGEMDEPESLGAISLGGREHLDNLVFVINCNLQRLDGPVRGNGKIIQELEADFRGAGWNVIKVLWGSGWDQLLANDWKDGIVRKLTGGLSGLAKQRKVKVVTGAGSFLSPKSLLAKTADGDKTISFDQAIVACGSEPITLPFILHSDPRVIDSTGALELNGLPKRLLVLGGGIIGLEMATVYHSLGVKVTVVELMDQIIPGADKDIVTPLMKRIGKRYENILLKTKVTAVTAEVDGLRVTFEGPNGVSNDLFDRLLVSVGRRPNGKMVGADAAGVAVDERGFIAVDKQMRTNVPHIFAIGDVVGQPMLAHKAVHEAKVAAEVAAGKNSAFDAKVIPSVAYTDPEVAWVGVTESEAKASGIKYGKGVFPWAASGRSLSLGRDEGITKVLFDEEHERIIGCGIVGPSAGDLIAEAALAIEMGADAADIGMTIHPHPTLSETIGMAAEAFEGTITDLYMPKKK